MTDDAKAFAEELTRIVMKVASKMSKQEREVRLNKLRARLSVIPEHRKDGEQ